MELRVRQGRAAGFHSSAVSSKLAACFEEGSAGPSTGLVLLVVLRQNAAREQMAGAKQAGEKGLNSGDVPERTSRRG